MKTIRFFALASIVAGAMLAQGCAKDALENAVSSGDKVTAVISVAADPQTKAVADNDGFGESVKRCIIQVRMDGRVFEQKTIEGTTGHYETSIDLITGQKYEFLAWVDGGEGYYSLDENGVVTCLKDVINDDAADAFSGTEILDLSATSDAKVTIFAKRPFAQINLITKGLDRAFLPKSISVKLKAPKSFDMLNGTFGDAQDFSATVTDMYKPFRDDLNTVVMAYIFADAQEKTILDEIELGAVFEGEAHRILSNIPVQQNYRTNVTGNLFANGGNVIVDIVPGWDNPDIDKVLWDGSTAPVPDPAADGFIHITDASELAGLAKAVNEGNTFSGKTVVLDNDMDLDNCPWTPIGNLVSYPSVTFAGTFDGGEHTISNLNASDSTPDYACAGLFGSTLGTVKNLNLKDVKVSSTHYAGAVVAYSSSSESNVFNCHVDGGTITSSIEWTGSEYDNGDKAGGIFGYSGGGATIDGCSVNNVSIKAYRHIGGIAGYASGNISNNVVGNVTIFQDNTHGYKAFSSISDTFHEIAGYCPNQSGNTFSNVTIKSGSSVSSQSEFEAAVASAAAGAEICLAAGSYTIPAVPQNITISGEDGVVFNCAGSGSIASIPDGVTFEGCEFDFGQGNYHGFQHAGTINMKDCTLNGLLFSYGDMNFTGCHFVQTATDYNMWAYGQDLTFTDCVFDSCGKFINVYNEGSGYYSVTCNGCEFNSSVVNKPALNIKATSGTTGLHHDVFITDCSASFTIAPSSSDSKVVGSALWQVDDINPAVDSSNKVTVDGVVVYNGK